MLVYFWKVGFRVGPLPVTSEEELLHLCQGVFEGANGGAGSSGGSSGMSRIMLADAAKGPR